MNYADWRVEDSTLLKHVSGNYPELDQETGPWKILVSKENRAEILKQCHDSVTSGHLGIYKTFERIKVNYYWPKMWPNITCYIRRCQVCLAQKSEHRPPSGLMGSFPNVT